MSMADVTFRIYHPSANDRQWAKVQSTLKQLTTSTTISHQGTTYEVLNESGSGITINNPQLKRDAFEESHIFDKIVSVFELLVTSPIYNIEIL
jgi:hypothetical protein